MTLTIPTTHAAVSDNPILPCEALCPRDGLCRIRLGGEWQLWPTRRFWHAAWMRACYLLDRGVTDFRLVRDPLAPVEVCEWCGQHVCRVCKGKHRRCAQRASLGWLCRRPQWRGQGFAQWQRREVDAEDVLREGKP